MLRHPGSPTLGVIALFTFAPLAISQDNPQSKPATVVQLRDAVDWTKMPMPPGAQTGRTGFSLCSYQAPGTFLDAAAFFREKWPALGWKEDATPIPGVDQKDYLYLSFDKGDMRISVNGYRIDPKGPMTITLSLNGNVDLRSIPKPADAKFLSNSRTAAFFTTASSPKDAVEFCRKGILALGWKEVPDESAAFFAKEGRIIAQFQQNAMQIGLNAAKNMAGMTEVMLTSSVRSQLEAAQVREALTPKELVEPQAEKEYLSLLDLRALPLLEGAKKQARQTVAIARPHQLICQAPAKIDDAVKWYRKEFTAKEWKETLFDQSISDRVSMRFEKQGFLVEVNFRKPQKEELQVSITNYGNVDLRQLPYPAGVEIPPERTHVINTSTTVSESEAVEFFRKELKAMKWTEVKGRGRASYEFFKLTSHLHVEVQKGENDRTSIQISQSLITTEKDKE
ncbi:MAG: hypothetical protein U0798_10020 [Gemmataceae bacterium]